MRACNVKKQTICLLHCMGLHLVWGLCLHAHGAMMYMCQNGMIARQIYIWLHSVANIRQMEIYYVPAGLARGLA